jgi:hypothetical protein
MERMSVLAGQFVVEQQERWRQVGVLVGRRHPVLPTSPEDTDQMLLHRQFVLASSGVIGRDPDPSFLT